MNEINITINNQPIKCSDGESILQVARRVGIEIPAICYLQGCSPTVACKLCMVDIDGKRNYSCNAKVKEGMNVLTHTDEIKQERNAIMQSYDVNHPLQCGVCDKSGECELQNYTLKMQVTSQNYCIKESDKPFKSWAKAVYDPNLCIMCERCATTCKDNIGEANLKGAKADTLEPLDTNLWKDTMPKDALSVWARKQKGLIDFVGEAPCFDCGECISVCPVGALSTNDFKYKANAWELKSIDSTCYHCAMGCKISYDVRHNDSLGTPHIFRIKNDFYFNPICGAARYGYDITSTSNARQNLETAIAAFRSATAINIGNLATNEEALVLNHIAKTLNIPLHNDEALQFKSFISTYLHYAKREGLNNLDVFDNSENLIFIGTALNYEALGLRYKLNNKLKMQKGTQVLYFHPLFDNLIASLSRNVTHIGFKQDSLDIALSAIALAFVESGTDSSEATNALRDLIKPLLDSKVTQSKMVDKEIKETITRVNENNEEVQEEVAKIVQEEVSETYYEALKNAGLEAFSNISQMIANKPLVIVGAEVFNHARATTLAHILGLLESSGAIKVLLIPPFSNALGIAMLCDLAPKDNTNSVDSSYTIGFRAKGNFVLESNFISQDSAEVVAQSPDFILPALNQMEGTYMNMDSRILPLRAALKFSGYDLSDIARAFGMDKEYLIDYTPLICGESFDNLPNAYLNDGTNNRGIRLDRFSTTALDSNSNIESITLDSNTSTDYNAYKLFSPSQFNTYTAKGVHLQNKMGIYVSKEKLEALGLKEGEMLELLDSSSKQSISAAVYIDYYLQEPYFLINPMIEGVDNIFKRGYWAKLEATNANNANIAQKESL